MVGKIQGKRETGIKGLGAVPWGVHICLLFDTKRDLITTTLPYFKAGLENNEFCLWITSDSPGIKKVGDIIKKKTPYFSSSARENQIDILPFTSVGAKAGELDLLKLHWIMADRLKRAIDTGYDGLRVAFDLSWAEKAEWGKMTAQLAKCRKTKGKVHMLAFFAYPLDKCGAKEYINLIGDRKYSLIINNGKMVQLKDLCARTLTEKYNNIQNLSKNLHEAEERFRKAARASPDIISITTLDKGKFLYVNDNFLRFYGYTRDEVIGRTIIELNLNLLTNIKQRGNMIERLKRQGRIQNGEAVLRSKSGETCKVKYSNELHVIKGQPCIITVFTDITALKKEEEKERAIINTAIDGFCITDINGKILEANESYCQMVGYTREELLRMSVKDIEAQENPQEVANRLRRGMKIGPERFKTRHRRKDGQIIDVEVNANFYNVGEGQFFAFIRDITGSKELESGRETDTKISWRKNITKLQEKFIKEGLENFRDREIIELLLSMVMPSRKARQLAGVCINKFKNFSTFLNASPEELTEIGVSPTSVFCIAMLHKLPIKVLQEKISKQSIYDSPQDIFDYFYYAMRDLEKEVFKVIFLNARNQIIEIVDLFEGTTDKITINPRKVVENAIAHKTSFLVFIHNHPSGDPTPSQADKQLTRDLVFVGNILQIRVLDHIIIGDNRYFSFAREGLIKEYEMDFLNLKITGTAEAKRRLSKARLPFIDGVINSLLN